MTAVSPRWLDAQHARADEPPRSPRQPLWAGAAPVGSVEPGLMQALLPALAGVLRPMVRAGEAGWALEVPVTQGMNHIALALREAEVLLAPVAKAREFLKGFIASFSILPKVQSVIIAISLICRFSAVCLCSFWPVT